jgi:hypothetical protein
MTGSPTVLAADGGAADCADHWLRQTVHDRFGLDWLAGNARALVATPTRILLGSGAGAGSR